MSAQIPGLNLGQDDKVTHGRSKKNATQFFLYAQTIVDEEIWVTGTGTWLKD